MPSSDKTASKCVVGVTPVTFHRGAPSVALSATVMPNVFWTIPYATTTSSRGLKVGPTDKQKGVVPKKVEFGNSHSAAKVCVFHQAKPPIDGVETNEAVACRGHRECSIKPCVGVYDLSTGIDDHQRVVAWLNASNVIAAGVHRRRAGEREPTVHAGRLRGRSELAR